jgi:PAS domain S-box-containing protein
MQEETELKQSEEALRASELRYRRLFETAKDGILILDAQTGQIRDVNPFLVDLLGYTHNEFIGLPLWEIGPFKDIKECKLAFLELQDKEYIRYESLPLETKDGRSINRCSLSRHRPPRRTGRNCSGRTH